MTLNYCRLCAVIQTDWCIASYSYIITTSLLFHCQHLFPDLRHRARRAPIALLTRRGLPHRLPQCPRDPRPRPPHALDPRQDCARHQTPARPRTTWRPAWDSYHLLSSPGRFIWLHGLIRLKLDQIVFKSAYPFLDISSLMDLSIFCYSSPSPDTCNYIFWCFFVYKLKSNQPGNRTKTAFFEAMQIPGMTH